jgi:hypothetical protein
MASQTPRTAIATDSASEGSTLRSIVSLVLFIHLFCVAVVLGSNFRRSALQRRLVALFAPYTQLLHFDPDFVPYHYTSGLVDDHDVVLNVTLYPDATTRPEEQTQLAALTLPVGGTNWLADRHRWLTLAGLLAVQAELQNDDAASEIARAVSARLIREHNADRPEPEQAHWAVVQCVRFITPPLDRPTDDIAQSIVYEADVRLLEDGQWSVTRRQQARDVAPVRGSAGD